MIDDAAGADRHVRELQEFDVADVIRAVRRYNSRRRPQRNKALAKNVPERFSGYIRRKVAEGRESDGANCKLCVLTSCVVQRKYYALNHYCGGSKRFSYTRRGIIPICIDPFSGDRVGNASSRPLSAENWFGK